MLAGYKLVDFGGASRDIATKQTVPGIYNYAKDAADNKIPIKDINMMAGSALSLTSVGSNFNRAYMSGTDVVVEVGAGKKATIGTDDGVTFASLS